MQQICDACKLYNDHKQIKYFAKQKTKTHRIHSQEWMVYKYQTLDNGNEYVCISEYWNIQYNIGFSCRKNVVQIFKSVF